MRVGFSACPDSQQILARYADAEFGREAVVEGNEVAPQLGAAALVEARRQRLGRTVAGRERVPCRLAARLAVERGSSLEAQIEGVAEQLANALRLAPFERRGRRRIGRRRHVRLHHHEHLEKIAVGKPRRQRHASALARHASDLGRGRLRTACEHDAAGGDDRIEFPVGERKVLGVADVVLDIEALHLRPLARGCDQIARDVGADDFGAARCHRARGPARSGRKIQHALAGLRIEPQHAMLDRIRYAAADLIVARAAGAPHAGRLSLCGWIAASAEI